MAESKIEQVARAQERARNPQWTEEQFEVWWNEDPFFCERVTSWGYFTGTRKGHCLFEARAAIEAMREPTEAMVDGAYDAHDAYEAAPEPKAWSGLASAYRGMIDAALNEQVSG
jgi:hypothetical protein